MAVSILLLNNMMHRSTAITGRSIRRTIHSTIINQRDDWKRMIINFSIFLGPFLSLLFINLAR